MTAETNAAIEGAFEGGATEVLVNDSEQIASIETPGPETVIIKTKIAWAPLPSGLALYANSIVPKNYGGKTKEALSISVLKRESSSRPSTE